jgi:serine protease Do
MRVGRCAAFVGLLLAACTPRQQFAMLPAPSGAQEVREGTGFFVRADGVVATAAHVVHACRRIDVLSDDVPDTPADLVVADERADLALLRVPAEAAPTVLVPQPLPPQGADLVEFGYPGGQLLQPLQQIQPALLNSYVRRGEVADPNLVLWLQAPEITHGWSGGPIVNARDGSVVGMLLAVAADPANTARVLDQPFAGAAIATGSLPIRYILRRARPPAAAAPAPIADSAASAERAVVRVLCWR